MLLLILYLYAFGILYQLDASTLAKGILNAAYLTFIFLEYLTKVTALIVELKRSPYLEMDIINFSIKLHENREALNKAGWYMIFCFLVAFITVINLGYIK